VVISAELGLVVSGTFQLGSGSVIIWLQGSGYVIGWFPRSGSEMINYGSKPSNFELKTIRILKEPNVYKVFTFMFKK